MSSNRRDFLRGSVAAAAIGGLASIADHGRAAESSASEVITAIETIYFIHHSHTDVGFTHDQPIVFELHERFIAQAMEVCERCRERRDTDKARGMRRKAAEAAVAAAAAVEPVAASSSGDAGPAPARRRVSQTWAMLIKRVYEVDPLACPCCIADCLCG